MHCKNHCDVHSHCCSSEHETCIELVPIFKGLTEEEMLEIAGITSSRVLEKVNWHIGRVRSLTQCLWFTPGSLSSIV